MRKEDNIRLCYNHMKDRHGFETIVLFHVRDFYEAYFEDAKIVSQITDIPVLPMTAAKIPSIRIPVYLMEKYRNQLLDAGHKICLSEVRGISGYHILKIQ